MGTRFKFRTSVIAQFAFTVLTDLALVLLIAVDGHDFLTTRSMTASLLILGYVVFSVSGYLFTGRTMWKWKFAETPAYLRWERGLVLAALLLLVLGLALLATLLRSAGDSGLAQIALVTYFFGAVLVAAAETVYLDKGETNAVQVATYVVLAFAAQALFGAALLRTGLVASWVGWATILWNLGWLLVMVVVHPRDTYYPALHHAAPLLIGIVLLIQ